MKPTLWVVSAALLFGTPVRAQAPAPGKVTLVTGVQRTYDTVKRNLIEAAEKMPDADFSFSPAPGIRTFGQLFGHVANSHFSRCSGARGEPNPNQGNDYEKRTTKAEIVQALKDSFGYCDPVYESLTEENAVEFIRGAAWQGQAQVMRGFALADNVTHDNEMYGTAAVYLRVKGLVPPSTERQMQSRKP